MPEAHIGHNLAAGDLPDRDGHFLAVVFVVFLIEFSGQHIHPVIGRVGGELRVGGNFNVDLACALHRDGENGDISQRVGFVRVIYHVQIDGGILLVDVDAREDCVHLFDGVVTADLLDVGSGIVVDLLAAGEGREQQNKNKGKRDHLFHVNSSCNTLIKASTEPRDS